MHSFAFFLAVYLNSFLIYLILTKSPRKMGNYKYLLIYFCSFSICYSILDVIVQPYIHSYGSTFFMAMDLKTWDLSQNAGYVFISLLCGCFAISITTIAIQFIFRFLALERKGRISFFHGKFLIIWFLAPLIVAAIWMLTLWKFMRPKSQMSEYIKDTVLQHYGLQIYDITYCGLHFYPDGQNLDTNQLVAYIVFSILMGVPFWTLIIFGVKSFNLVRKLPEQDGNSQYTRNLQIQLYKALVAQAFIPITFLFVPIGVLFTAPLVPVDIEPVSWLVTIFYTLYPAVDPLPTMLIVANYRKAVVKQFWIK